MSLNSLKNSLLSPTVAGVLSIASAAISGWLLRQGIPDEARVFAALLPLPFFALLLAAMVNWARRLDELGRQVQLDALAVTVGGTALMTFLFGYLQRAGILATRTWDDVWLLMALVYLASWWRAARRYK